MVFKSLPIRKLFNELADNIKISIKSIPEDDKWNLGYESIRLCTDSLKYLNEINKSNNMTKLSLIEKIKSNIVELRKNFDSLKASHGYKLTLFYDTLDKIDNLVCDWELLIKECLG